MQFTGPVSVLLCCPRLLFVSVYCPDLLTSPVSGRRFLLGTGKLHENAQELHNAVGIKMG